ncbi:MAG TPA: hypothetical protein P5270_02260 [Victivallales bacterium]|nr:hypothetical protein [Victivallales bacterium]HRR28162.1 hypothetical protein [Victivallales bacterium]HRU00272.1 hypothetical protein [Victivallales bacterium]
MIIFSILAVVMILSMISAYLIQGEFGEINVHLAAYGFILAGIGFVIELLTKREKDLDLKISYMLNKKFIVFSEELKTIRAMLLRLEEKRAKLEEKITESNSEITPSTTPVVEKIEYKIPPPKK